MPITRHAAAADRTAFARHLRAGRRVPPLELKYNGTYTLRTRSDVSTPYNVILNLFQDPPLVLERQSLERGGC